MIAAAQILTDNGTEILVGFIAMFGVIAAGWLASDRRTKRIGTKVDVLVESVGEKNGHGTVQDQGPAILAELAAIRQTQETMQSTQHAMQTSIDSIVDAAGLMRDRVGHHDREHKRHRQRLDEHEQMLREMRGDTT